jgi:PucR C-terminal helix-turn-helix domain
MSHSTSLAIVSSAVAGDGLERVARSASEALGHPVAVICPSAETPVVWPAEAVPPARLDELAAAAKAIVRLMGDGFDDPRDVVEALVSGPPADVDALVEQGRRLGVDLAGGAIAVCGLGGAEVVEDGDAIVALVAPAGSERVVGLVPLSDASERQAGALAVRLRGAGWLVGVSAPRRAPGLLHEAVREAMLLAELAAAPDDFAGQEETYRLLIGVLLRDPAELEQLRASTISPLLAYDAEHATELLTTLGTFLARHGSTTETAEAMQLHRHTVGYRLSRLQEVSGLSPYETDGRERLSLGLKAAQILAAQERLGQRAPQPAPQERLSQPG